jgi:hypothetical protein
MLPLAHTLYRKDVKFSEQLQDRLREHSRRFARGYARLQVLQGEWVYRSVMARAAQVAQIIIWAVILVLGVLAYWRYLEFAPMD